MKGQLTPAASAHLDMLRGFAAFAVLISHWRNFIFLDWPDLAHKPLWLGPLYFISGFGHQAVVIFFVLSGYLIGGIVLKTVRNETWSWQRYGFDRLARLGIVLLPALFLCLLWDEIGVHIFNAGWLYGGNAHLAEMGAVDHSLITFLGNCAFLQTIYVPTFGSDFPLWSLANEFWYYVLFPLAVLLWTRRGLPQRMICFILLLGIANMTKHTILAGFAIWLMGTSIFCFPPRNRIGSRVTIIAIAATALGLCVFLTLQRIGRVPSRLGDFTLGILFSLVLYFLIHGTTQVGERYRRVSKFIAGSSYTLYLVHFPILVCFLAATGRRWQPDFRHLAIGLGVLAVTYLYALGVARAFETRTDSIKRWLRPKLGF
jgi:peptidoglycan/LPS O-acetylase OafA/YrhL